MDSKIIDKVLAKKASPEEARKVAMWFSTDEGQEYLSQRYDRESYLLNEKTLVEWSDHEIPSERMSNRFLSLLKTRIRSFRFRVVAAVIIPFLVLTGALLFITYRSGIFAGNDMAEVTVPYGEQLQVVLQDGSLVQLNSGSRLQYPKSFGLFKRQVVLEGEGYFSIAKDADRPFFVNLNGIAIKVTGTKFNVQAYPENHQVDVALEEGGVEIIDDTKTYPLKPGENANYNRKNGICTIHEIKDITEYTAWRSHSLNFYRTPLKNVLKTLERQYDVVFAVPDSSLLEYKFSISTSKVNTREILTDLEKVSKIKFISIDTNHYEVISAE